EAGVDPLRHSALAGEERVPHARGLRKQARGQDGGLVHHGASKDGGGGRRQIAAALKSSPIWSAAVSRASWRPMTSARSGGTLASAWARASIPSRLRSSGGGGDGAEVDVDGQVGAARARQRIDLPVPAEGLQGVSRRRVRAPIVDQ